MIQHARGRRPNVVIVLFDDLGFADFGCFGSEISTPSIDRLARHGVRFNNFHVTSICSASRAALLTGRNHHAVGVAACTHDEARDEPGYTNRIPRSAATIARLLRDAGYGTHAVGKWHLAPPEDTDAAGPFDLWPLGMGFDHYYGFIGGMTSQYAPDLVRDNTFVRAPRSAYEGYHLTEDLADQAISYIRAQKHAAAEKPYLLYFAPGAMHSPHHVPREWAESYRGVYDVGWDEIRRRRFARQVDLGLIPPHASLTDRPSWVTGWSDLDDEEKRVFARQMEVYAGFLTHTDAQIGRLLDSIESAGDLDDTIFLVMSDNGAAGDGGPSGTFGTQSLTTAELTHRIDEWGGLRSFPSYSWGWAAVGTTPFRLWKTYTWLGGVKSPLVVHWPAGIPEAERGTVRGQFTHVTDVLPTLLEAAGVSAPAAVDGIAQQRLDGTSLIGVLADDATRSGHDIQYFEMLGSRAIYARGWKATTDHVKAEDRSMIEGSADFATDRWSLFHLDTDYSEAHDLADAEPERLAELIALWESEAERNHVLPLAERGIGTTRPISEYPRVREFSGESVGRPVTTTSPFGGISLVADLEASRFDGVVASLHNSVHGWTFPGGLAIRFDRGRLLVEVSPAGGAVTLSAADAVTSGRHRVAVSLTLCDGSWTVEAAIDDKDVLREEMRATPVAAAARAGSIISQLWVGCEDGIGVGDYDRLPPMFAGRIHRLVIETPARL